MIRAALGQPIRAQLSLTKEVPVQESRLTTLTRRGLMIAAEVREEIRKTGIRCRPQVEIVYQDHANRWKLREKSRAVLWHCSDTTLAS
jgi:hypothetical protein